MRWWWRGHKYKATSKKKKNIQKKEEIIEEEEVKKEKYIVNRSLCINFTFFFVEARIACGKSCYIVIHKILLSEINELRN